MKSPDEPADVENQNHNRSNIDRILDPVCIQVLAEHFWPRMMGETWATTVNLCKINGFPTVKRLETRIDSRIQ